MFRFDTLRDDTASTWKIVGILCILCLILLSTRQYFACWYIPVFASNTRSIVFQDFTLLAVFQCFPLCEVLRVQYYSEYFTRVCCSISRFDTLAILSTRSSWPSVVVVLLIYSQYSQYFGWQYYCNTLSTQYGPSNKKHLFQLQPQCLICVPEPTAVGCYLEYCLHRTKAR